MGTETITAERLRCGMKVFWSCRWEVVRAVEFGPVTRIRCDGAAIAVDSKHEVEVLLTDGGGYDFSDRVPDAIPASEGSYRDGPR